MPRETQFLLPKDIFLGALASVSATAILAGDEKS